MTPNSGLPLNTPMGTYEKINVTLKDPTDTPANQWVHQGVKSQGENSGTTASNGTDYVFDVNNPFPTYTVLKPGKEIKGNLGQ